MNDKEKAYFNILHDAVKRLLQTEGGREPFLLIIGEEIEEILLWDYDLSFEKLMTLLKRMYKQTADELQICNAHLKKYQENTHHE